MMSFIEKLKLKKGESIAETLVAVLIVAVVFVGLAQAIVTSAVINKKSENSAVAIKNGSEVTDGSADGFTVSIIQNGVTLVSTSPSAFEGNGYYYYELD